MSKEAKALADRIEQFMFERGEYDFCDGDRIRWIADATNTEPYELANNPTLLGAEREKVTELIEQALNGTASEETGGIEPLMNYLNDQLNEMDEEDELIQTAENLLFALDSFDGKEPDI